MWVSNDCCTTTEDAPHGGQLHPNVVPPILLLLNLKRRLPRLTLFRSLSVCGCHAEDANLNANHRPSLRGTTAWRCSVVASGCFSRRVQVGGCG